MEFDKEQIKNIKLRFGVFYVIICLIALWIFFTMIKVMFVEGDAWQEVGKVTEVDSIRLEASRGNILSADGQLMSSSLPNYKV